MFAKATKKFVEEIDPDGCLIPVSRLNETDNLHVLSLVIKRNRFWFWQRPKYIPTDFCLSDILLKEPPINAAVVETDFLKYNGTMENNASGSAEAEIGPGKLNIEGQGLSKMATSFGNLKKQEVEVRKLLFDTKNRCLDIQHCLIKQTLQRQREVFAVVKERIVTTQVCTVTEEVQERGTCSAFFGLLLPKKITVALKNGTLKSDSNVFIEIPAKTALAYSIMELRVRTTGHFELCLLPDASGAVELDGAHGTNTSLVYSMPPLAPDQKLQQDLTMLQSQFEVLSRLPASTRSCLFEQIIFLMKGKTAISALDLALEELIEGEYPDLSTLDSTPLVKKAVQSIVKLLSENKGTGQVPQDEVSLKQPSALIATEIISSALEEMNESTLCVFESCCQTTTIQALHVLVQNILDNRECSLKDSRLAPLAEENTYCKVQALFESSNVILTRKHDLIQAQISSQQGHGPLILCIAIFGLASLLSATY